MNRITRAWKEPAFRATLSDAELAELPNHPGGSIEFVEIGVDQTRGAGSEYLTTFGCCRPNQIITQASCLTCKNRDWSCHTCWGCS